MKIQQLSGMSQIPAEEWNSLVSDGPPFLQHQFLSALETSGCVCEETGWLPSHLALRDQGQLVAALPLYLKRHSRGEYVFDTQWAYAAGHYGQNYYPKWLTSIPFTPCLGKRLLVKDGYEELPVLKLFLDFIKDQSDLYQYSSWHCLFPDERQLCSLIELGLLIREGVQFHWFNRGYSSFDDFLAGLNSRKRKMIKRERQRVREQDIHLIQLSGSEVTAGQWQVFFTFYRNTYYKNGMPPYLNLEFFHDCASAMGDKILLVMAMKNNQYVGAALSFLSNDTFYGRYWGCQEEYEFLHFECCFYQGLDYCIANDLKRFDSGAQGEHKIARGFEPVITYSAHWLRDRQFSDAVERFLLREKNSVDMYKDEAGRYLPYKKLS